MILSSNADDEDPKPIEAYNGYQYYPSPLYEAGLPPPAKPEGHSYGVGRIKEEMGLFGPNSLLSGHGIGRFQGVDTSRGYYSVDTVY
jgi:meiosis-specific transcription factor NDT80